MGFRLQRGEGGPNRTQYPFQSAPRAKLRLEMQSVHSPSSFGRIMFQIWKVATEAQFEWFTDSFQEEMQRRIPEAFEEALNVFSTLCDEHEGQ